MPLGPTTPQLALLLDTTKTGKYELVRDTYQAPDYKKEHVLHFALSSLTNGHYLIPIQLINHSSKCKGSYLTTTNHVLMHLILKFIASAQLTASLHPTQGWDQAGELN